MNYKATTKQRSYFHSLTGEWPSSGASKSEVSRLIKKALAGEIQRKPDVVRVYGWQFSGLAAECLKEELKGVSYAVSLNYTDVTGSFKTLADAETFARARFPDAQIEVSTSIRQQYMD